MLTQVTHWLIRSFTLSFWHMLSNSLVFLFIINLFYLSLNLLITHYVSREIYCIMFRMLKLQSSPAHLSPQSPRPSTSLMLRAWRTTRSSGSTRRRPSRRWSSRLESYFTIRFGFSFDFDLSCNQMFCHVEFCQKCRFQNLIFFLDYFLSGLLWSKFFFFNLFLKIFCLG